MMTLLLLSTGQLCNAQQYRTETFRIAAKYLSDVTAAHFFGDASYLEIQDNTSKFPNNSLEWILSNFSHGYLTDNNSSDWHSSLYPALSPATSDRNIIQPQSSGIVPFTIKGALGQTADVFQILDNSNNRTFRLTAEGYLETEGGIHPGYTTSTTSGNIRFTGSDIEGYVGGSWKSLTAGNILEGSGVIKGGSPNPGNVAYWDTVNSITGLDGFRYDQANTQLTVEGTVSASQLKSTTTTVPPLTVQSTQKVTNLNSDLLDGYDSSYFLNFLSGGNVFLIGGDTSTSTYTVNNPYGHRNVFVEVIEAAAPYNRVLCTKSLPTTSTVQITFSSPQSIQYVVIIEEAEDNTLFGPGLTVEHSLNSTDILFQVWRNSGDYDEIVTGAEITSATYITIITSTVFSSNEGNVVFKTARDSVNIGDTASELINHEWNTRFFLSMMMDNSSNEISFAGTRFNKLNEIEIDFSSTPGADAIKFLYYPISANLDNNELYILLSGANKDKVSGTHFNPSVNIDVGAVTANIVTVTESINFSPDLLHYGIVGVDDPYLYIKSNVNIRLDPTWDGTSDGIITAAAAIDFDEYLGHKLDLWADSYWIGVEPFTLELGTDRNILLKNDLGYAYMYLNESGVVGDVTVTGQLWSAGVSSSIQSQLDALGGLLGYSIQNTSPLVDNATDIVTANAVYDWVTGLGYITSSALTPYLKKDGSVAMTGSLNMGGQAITNMSGTTNYTGASLSISGGITASTISTTGVIEGDADAVFAGSVSADYFTAAGAGGVTSGGVFTLLTGIRWNAGTLQVKSRNIALQGGIATLLGTETGWTNVPNVP